MGGWVAGLALEVTAFPLQANPDAVFMDAVVQLGLIAGPGVFVLGVIGKIPA